MRKCYDYIISIGLNCEIRYQLRKKFGAIESSLLEWAAIYPQHLIDVLKNPNLIFSEQIEELPKFNMWKCCLTNMTFHGKKLVNELLDQDGNRDEEKVAIEKQDTICRIKYLSNKFIKIANSEFSKLYVLGIHPDFCKYKNEELLTFVQNVSETICKIAKNASLLIIVSQEDFNTINILDNDKNLFIRQVKHFAPYNKSTSPEYVDLESGDKIFSEFVLKEQKVDNKIYKFEKECAI